MARNETGFFPKVITNPEILLKREKTNSQETSKRVIAIRQKYPNMTLAVIGWNVGLTHQRVHQILKKAGLLTSGK